MVRVATEKDAGQLEALNNEFNGEGETTLDHIRSSLADNRQEIVVVDEANGELTGFVCVQLKRSFCYDDYMPEITEVYAEEYCKKQYPLHELGLLTGSENTVAQAAYKNLGYCRDDEIHLVKRV